jgi:hypothetical protein
VLERKETTIGPVTYSLPKLPASKAFPVMRLCLKATAEQARALSGTTDNAGTLAAVLDAEADSWWSDAFFTGAIQPLLADALVDRLDGAGWQPLRPVFDLHFAAHGLQHLKAVVDAAVDHNFADFSDVLLRAGNTDAATAPPPPGPIGGSGGR